MKIFLNILVVIPVSEGGGMEGGKEGGREGGREGRWEGGREGVNEKEVVQSFKQRHPLP